jgi:hypothetical protein
MPANRQGRAAAAEALAAFLRGELPAIELRQRVLASVPEDDTFEDDYLVEFREMFSCGLYFNPESLPEDSWHWLVRHLAYLNTDLEPTPTPPSDDDPDMPDQIRLARWHVLALAGVVVLWAVAGWWVLPVGVVGSFLAYQAWMWRTNQARDQEMINRGAERMLCDPFASMPEWYAHRHLAEAYQLPEYDPARNPRPARTTSRIGMSAMAVGAVTLGLLVVVVCAFSLVLWPLWLVLMAIQPVPTPAET